MLTVLAQEPGHLLGNEHSDDGTMHDTLATGERLMPTPNVAPVEPAVFDLIFIEEREKEQTWASDVRHNCLDNLDLALTR